MVLGARQDHGCSGSGDGTARHSLLRSARLVAWEGKWACLVFWGQMCLTLLWRHRLCCPAVRRVSLRHLRGCAADCGNVGIPKCHTGHGKPRRQPQCTCLGEQGTNLPLPLAGRATASTAPVSPGSLPLPWHVVRPPESPVVFTLSLCAPLEAS